MPPASAEIFRAHLTQILDIRLTRTARRLQLGSLQSDIRRGCIPLKEVIHNPHLQEALDPSLTLSARKLALNLLLRNPTLTLSEVEVDTVRALTLPIRGEEVITQLATAIISRLAPPSSLAQLVNPPAAPPKDDGLTVRILPKAPPLPVPRIDDLRDLQELQGLIARKASVKQNAERLIAAYELLQPYLNWESPVADTILKLGDEYRACVAIADRAAILYKKTNAAAVDISGREYFELPELSGWGIPMPWLDTAPEEAALNAARGRFREIIISFNEMKSTVETYALKLAAGSVPRVNVDEEVQSMQIFLESLRSLIKYLENEHSFFSKPENKYQLKGTTNLTIAAQFSALQDLIFEIGQAYEVADRNYSEVLNFNNSAKGKMLQMLEQLKAYSDLSGVKEAVAALEKTAEEMYTAYINAGLKNGQEHQQAMDQVIAAFSVPVRLKPQIQAPPAPAPSGAGPVTPPAPPKPVNPLEVALEESKCLVFNITGKTGGARPAEVSLLEKLLWMAPHGIEEQDRNRAMDIADIALSVRNKLAVALPEVADLAKQIQRRMEKYLATTHKLFVLEPTLGTQQPRVHDKVEVVGDETGKFGEILRVTSLGYIDADGKLVRKAKVIIGDGTVFTSKSFDTAGPARPESWSRVPPPDVPAGPAPVSPPMPVPSAPPAPSIPLRVKAVDLAQRVGRRIWKRWLKVNGAVYRFQSRVVKAVVAAAKKINGQVIRLNRWEIRLEKSIKERLLYQNVINLDVFYKNKWASSENRKIGRFGNGLFIRFAPEGNSLAEVHKVGSRYFLKITGNQQVTINGWPVTEWQQVNHGDTISVGEHMFVIDILPLRRSFKRGRGVEWIAGGESGEIVVEQGALLSSRGGRTHQEDAVAHAWINEDEELFVVGDGMGGHATGEIAGLRLMETVVPEMRSGKELSGAIERASEVIDQESKSNPRRHGMGTTVVAALINHKTNRLQLAWVGDSRGKYIPQDAAQQAGLLTRDHAVYWDNEKLGIKPLAEKLPIEETRLEEIAELETSLEKDPIWIEFKHSITQVVGHPSKLKIHVVEIPFLPGPPVNTLLLSSDGLRRGLTEKWVTELVRQGGSPEVVAKRLIAAALKLGTDDNISVAVIPVPALDLSQPIREEIFENKK